MMIKKNFQKIFCFSVVVFLFNSTIAFSQQMNVTGKGN
jgi:hypothetical protein